MLQLFVHSPLLLLFAVCAVGYLVGRIEIAGFSLGVAAVLFAGLAAGALHPDLKLPEVVQMFGLVLFVYSVGLSSGPGFFRSFRRRGLRDNGLALAVLLLGAAMAVGLAKLLGVRGPIAAGIFTGALTNTPALASVLDALKGTDAQMQPVVGYSVAYPFGVLGVIAAMWLAEKLFRGTAEERVSRQDLSSTPGALENVTVCVERDGWTRDRALTEFKSRKLAVIFGRIKRGDDVTIVNDETTFAVGDLVSLVGPQGDLQQAASVLGRVTNERLDLDRHVLDFRRVFVSNADVTERPLASLEIAHRFGALVTRIRRGDVEIVPTDDAELELGDRVRVVAQRERMGEVSKFFGDSYKALAEIDVITFSVGVALGLLLGSVPIPLPGGATFKLGMAGGPLIVGLVLGRLGRTGRVVWTLPFSANLTLRQLGLVLFLAGVGTRSGRAFVETLARGGGVTMLLAGAAITTVSALTTMFVLRRVFRAPMALAQGMVSGLHTQPAALAFASQRNDGDLPNVGYAMIYPLATIAKIVLAQVILVVLR